VRALMRKMITPEMSNDTVLRLFGDGEKGV